MRLLCSPQWLVSEDTIGVTRWARPSEVGSCPPKPVVGFRLPLAFGGELDLQNWIVGGEIEKNQSGPSGTRTQDQLIKSQLLYQLS